MSTLPDGFDGLKAARLLYGPAPDRTPEPADAGDDDALFEAWATGYRTGLRDGKERALDTGSDAGGQRS